ncbi:MULTISPECIES: hypothetical protein [Burkholderia]|uniref:Terminase small subunit n=1 Tax=Burkholderia pyrrocinia TaxID=60550 RepID=A0A318J120_BURPY|nr:MULTISPECIES: hypothetical protein [Burkholderia]PXX37648.1 hypothetical protein NA66_1004296 [Burkholderia pyrrocinia]SFW35830.1 hypothetical protein SAMN03159384_01499 [Burkholderia sp. NFACC33-1]SFX90622.1 hypothetical protein SAMN03159408_02564 [Burkholderia sp. NFPP32]
MPRLVKLNDRHLKYIDGRLAGKSGPVAAREAGFCESRASDLARNPLIVAELDRRRAELREKAGYDFDAAMKELETAAAFAVQTKNATALTRVAELRMKLAGLLKDKDPNAGAGNVTFVINGVTPQAPRAEIADNE